MPLTLLAACAAASLTAAQVAAAPAPVTVKISNFTFAAPTITVAPGTTVTWINDDDIPHTVVADDKAFRSKVLDTGDRFAFTFTTAGRYGYFCSIHPHMTGVVVVKAP
jgi:plastocyanin